MITGKSQGTGTFSFHKRIYGDREVSASLMPEDHHIRVTFSQYEEKHIPIIKLTNRDAEALWAVLNSMAKDLKWKDLES
jgi:hypothetical protein